MPQVPCTSTMYMYHVPCTMYMYHPGMIVSSLIPCCLTWTCSPYSPLLWTRYSVLCSATINHDHDGKDRNALSLKSEANLRASSCWHLVLSSAFCLQGNPAPYLPWMKSKPSTPRREGLFLFIALAGHWNLRWSWSHPMEISKVSGTTMRGCGIVDGLPRYVFWYPAGA